MDYIEIGPVPASEPCAQVGTENYLAHSLHECEVFKRMLVRLFPVPDGVPAAFVVRSHPHDFGTYCEVAIRYQSGNQGAVDFAYLVETAAPDRWDSIAKYELSWFERRDAISAAVRSGELPPTDVPKHYAAPTPPQLPPGSSFPELLSAYPL